MLAEERLEQWRNIDPHLSNENFMIFHAFEILKNQTTKEIMQLGEEFSALLKMFSPENTGPYFASFPKDDNEPEEDGVNFPRIYLITISHLYQLCEERDQINLKDNISIDCNWSELYAAYAIMWFSKFYDYVDSLKEASGSMDKAELSNKWLGIVKMMIEPTSAIHIAIYLHSYEMTISENIDNPEKFAAEKISARAKYASRKKYHELTDIKNRFLYYFETHEFHNKAEAARKYYRLLREDEQRILCPSKSEHKAVRTLTEHLRGWQKQNQI